MKQLKDFENEEEFLKYLALELEDYVYETNQKQLDEDERFNVFTEFFMAHSCDNVLYFKKMLYGLANDYLGYNVEIPKEEN